eukprot:jgi/Tetstr1/434867/TSEL_002581.t1
MSSSDRAGDLIGWMGETHQVPRQPIAQTSHTRGPLQVLSWERRAFLYSGFLTLEECDHLISVATPRMSRSGVWMPTQAAP